MKTSIESFNVSNPMQWEERLKLIGYCMLIKKSVIDQIGLLDEQFTPGNYEDDDYSLRIRKAGYRLLLCKDTFIHHFGSVSFREDQSYTELMRTNRQKFMAKWGFDPDVAQVINQEIVQLIRKPNHLPLRILEIGCYCGGTLLQIRNFYPNAELYGIEWNAAERETAAMVAQTIEDRQDFAIKNPLNFYDVILVSRVPDGQHLEELASQLLPYLKKDGTLLAQLPNLLYYRVAHNFLHGRASREELAYYKSSDVEPFHRLGMKQVEVNVIAGFVHPKDEAYVKGLSALNGLGIDEPYRIQSFIVRSSQLDRKDALLSLLESVLTSDNEESCFQELIQYDVDEVAQTVIEQVKEAAKVFNSLAILGYSAQQYDWTQRMLNKAFELEVANDDTFYNMAVVLHGKGEHQLACEWFKLIHEPGEEARQFEAGLQAQMAEEHFIKSELKYLLRRIEFEIEVNLSIETLFQWLGNDDAKLDLLNVYTAQHIISKAKVLNSLATGAYEQEQYEIVIPLLQKALEYEPFDPTTIYNLSFVLYQAGEKELAQSYLQQLRTEDQALIAAAQELEEALS